MNFDHSKTNAAQQEYTQEKKNTEKKIARVRCYAERIRTNC